MLQPFQQTWYTLQASVPGKIMFNSAQARTHPMTYFFYSAKIIFFCDAIDDAKGLERGLLSCVV